MNQEQKQEKTIENKRRRLIFRSAHRGTKEMDLILGSFATKNVPNFSENDLHDYDALLEQSDPDLYNWITGKEIAPEPILSLNVYKELLDHKLS